MAGVDADREKFFGVLFQPWVIARTFQDFHGEVAQDVTRVGIHPTFGVDRLEMGQEATGQVAVTNAPLHNEQVLFVVGTLAGLLVIVFGQGMGQPVIETDVGLKMVVDPRPLDAVKNFVDVGLPLIGGFKVTKRQGAGLRIHENCLSSPAELGGESFRTYVAVIEGAAGGQLARSGNAAGDIAVIGGLGFLTLHKTFVNFVRFLCVV